MAVDRYTKPSSVIPVYVRSIQREVRFFSVYSELPKAAKPWSPMLLPSVKKTNLVSYWLKLIAWAILYKHS
jgi:hypothetical protein